MFFTANNFVLPYPCTLTFLQDLIAKKNAPANKSHLALSIRETDSLRNSCSTDPVIAICGFSPLPKTLYPHRMNVNLLSGSNLGIFWSASLKPCAMLSKAALTDSDVGFVEHLILNLPSLMA